MVMIIIVDIKTVITF